MLFMEREYYERFINESVPVYGCLTSNSIAHRYGITPYNKLIAPTFNKLATYLSLGEGYHNFHHTFPYDYSTGECSWKENFNLSTLFIDIFAYFG
jgi:stearoyl-CoA desaturase (delta-9 desaturase)